MKSPSRALPWLTSPAVRLCLGSLAVAATFWAPAFFEPQATGFGDWQMIHHNWEVGWVALTRFGEWPLWDPYHCGGIPVWGNPESQHFSPLFALAFLAGPTVGAKLFVLLHAWAGVAGMVVAGRRELQLSPAAAWTAAISWSCSGFFAWQLGAGHVTFVAFYVAPLLWLAWRAAARDLRYAAAAAALMTLTILEGGTYPAPYFALLLGFDALVRVLGGHRLAPIVKAAALAVALTALASAVRLWPIAETLARLPRTIETQDSLRLYELGEMLLRWSFPWVHPSHPFVYSEYTAFVGFGIPLAAAVGMLVAWRRRALSLPLGALFFASLALGARGPYAPWSLIHELPVYDSLRVPSRFSVLFTFYLALLAGLALDALPGWLASRPHFARLPPRLQAALPWLLLGLIALVPSYYNLRTVSWLFHDPPIQTEERAERFHLVQPKDYHRAYASLPRRHLGTPQCYAGNMRWPVAHGLWVGPEPQARLEGTPGEVGPLRRTTNTATLRVQTERRGTLVVNQNYDPHWQASHGQAVQDDEGRLAIQLPPGARTLELRYRPWYLPLALGLSGAGLALTGLVPVALTWRRRQRPK